MIKYTRTRLFTMGCSHTLTATRAHFPWLGKIVVLALLCVAITACSSESGDSGSVGAVPPSQATSADSITEAQTAAAKPLIALDDGQAGGEQPVTDNPPTTGEPPVAELPPLPDVGNCTNCSNRQVSLDWSAAANSDIGYFVYYGINPDNVSVLATSIVLDKAAGLNENFSVSLSADADLGLEAGSPVCFSVSALTTFGETDRSNPVCQTL